jgi:crotonobetainyl-CoA:carnitine CoA-transferase CaiB-like acyl-CoA transferase
VLNLGFLTVADLSGGPAGRFCARRFADHGAEVVLAAPAAGPPGDRTDALAAHLDAGKRPLGDEPLADLVRRADIVVLPGGEVPDLPVTPQTVRCRITEFGDTGPRAGWRGGELVHQALSGLAHATGAADRPPLPGFGHRAYHAAGAAAFAAAMAAVVERRRSGLGQLVEVSVAEVAATTSPSLIAQYSYNGTYPRRGAYPGLVDTYRCRDGWVVMFVLSGRWQATCSAYGLGDVVDDERFATAKALNHNWPEASKLIAAKLRERDVADVVRLGEEHRLAVEAVADLPALMAAPDELPTGFWAEEVDGRLVTGPLPHPEPRRAALPAPATGPRRRPLEGMRVLELTTAWAGPLTGRSLGFLGAEVIKVESRRNIDSWRGAVAGGDVRRYPDLTPGDRPYNRSSWFNTENSDKLSVELNLKDPGAMAVMHELISVSDVLVCNLAPGALRRLGLDYRTLSGLNAGIVLLEINGFGSNSPLAGHVGVGPTVEATTGAMSLIGYGDGVPYNSGSAYLDPLSGLLSTGLVLAALATGRGHHLELNLRGVGLQLLGEHLRGFPAVPPPPACPHGVFAAAGSDEWLAVAAYDEQQWQSLCAVLDRPDLGADPELATPEGRLRRREELEAAVTAWSRSRDKHEAADFLQEHGVAAAPVCSGADLAADPHLEAIGFYRTFDHPEAGRHRYQGLPYRLAATPGRIRRVAPCLGADTADVLRRVLGKSETEISALLASGAATDTSRPG